MLQRLAISAAGFASASLGPAAVAAPLFYGYDVNGGSGTFSVEMPVDPAFTGFAPLLSFDLTAVLEDEDAVETVELTFTLADFDGPAEQPQAFFDSGAVTFLEVNGGEGTVSDGGGEEFDFALFLFDNEANLQALRLSDSKLFTACCGFAVTPAEGPPGTVIPEPAGATTFALGAALVLVHLRRRQAQGGSRGSTRRAGSA